MKWCRSIRWINALMLGSALLTSALVGCRAPREVYYLGETDLQHYKNKSMAVEYPNVDVTQEMVDLMLARRVFEANASVFQAAKAMLRRALDI